MSTYLVTGGAGFIGSHLCEWVLQEGNTVVCFDNFDSFYDPNIKIKNVEGIGKKFPGQFKLFTGDIRNSEQLAEVFKKNQIEYVVHLAARAGVRPSIKDPLLYQDVNIRGTIVLLGIAGMVLISTFVLTTLMAQLTLPQNLGMASGMMVGFTMSAGGIGVTLLGVIADTWGVPMAMKTIFALPLIASGLGLFLKYPVEKKQIDG